MGAEAGNLRHREAQNTLQKLYDGKQSDNSWKMPIENICVFSTKVEWDGLSLTRERRDPHEPLRLRTTKSGVFRRGSRALRLRSTMKRPPIQKERIEDTCFETYVFFQ